MKDIKENIEDIINKIEKGQIPAEKAWFEIVRMKDEYISQYSEQSWHSYIGNKFEKVIYSIIKGYISHKKSEDPIFAGLDVLTEKEVKSNDILTRKLAVNYGEFLLLPDTDIVIVDYNFEDVWKSEVLAILSCKTSLRERIAQACYWKLKLLSSDITKNVRVFLVTTDNDDDFSIMNERERYKGKHRNRIIAEYELDGIYILREDFREEWESEKVKRYEKIFEDITKILRQIRKI
jgi:type II restriction enzyme